MLFLFAGAAQAEIVYQSSFGAPGTGPGQFLTPAGLAVNQANGDIYVVDRGRNRIQQFTSDGAFVRMWGVDVVKSGEDNQPVSEVQEVAISADSGTFTLRFGTVANTTAPIAFNATAGEVQAALNALPSINAGGGSVTVTGGPGGATGGSPYQVSFDGGPLNDTDVAQLILDASGLGIPVGTELTCSAGGFGGTLTYQWLTNGAPSSGPGANSSTYTTVAADAGYPIQCQAFRLSENSGSTQTSTQVAVISPHSGTPPPTRSSAQLPSPANPGVGTLVTCPNTGWTGSPTFTFQWYKDAAPIPGAASSTYTLTGGDVPGNIQCAVTGTNGGGQFTKFSNNRATSPPPSPAAPGIPNPTLTLPAEMISTVTTTQPGATAFETCKPSPPSDDVCQAGRAGGSAGQFNSPRAIAVDNSPGGSADVYVVDDSNFRVQKFSGSGAPILMWGKGVNKTTGGDICTVASGDVCGAGTAANDLTPGHFGTWPTFNEFSEFGGEVAVDSSGDVYVGDPGHGFQEQRIQKFSATGTFLAQAKIGSPVSVAVASSHNVYSANNFSNVSVLDPTDFTASGDGVAATTLPQAESPRHLAVDPNSDRVLVSDTNEGSIVCGAAGPSGRAIFEFDTEGFAIDCSVPTGAGALPQVTGLAISPTGLLYAAVGSQNTVKVFKRPEPTPPAVVDQRALHITSEVAEIQAQVNPGFETTTYRIEYGLADCASNPCTSLPGGEPVRGLKDVAVEPTTLTGLEPGTKYHYRVVAENRLGSTPGPGRTFTTFAPLDLQDDRQCPNSLARKQARAAALFDCRSYELASADFTGGYDVVSDLAPGQTPYDGYPRAEGKVLYAVRDGGIPGTGSPTNRGPDPYVATRRSDGTWGTEYVGIPADNPFAAAPFSSTLAQADAGLETFAFGGPDICSPCFADGSSGLPLRLPDGNLVQGMSGSTPQPAAASAGYVAKPLSADGSHFVFGSTAPFEPAGNDGEVTIYDRDLSSGTTEVASTLPNGNTIANGEGVGQLDISGDGSRILIGSLVSTDAEGNRYWDIYMHVGNSPASIEVADTASGVLYAGMTSDGSEVFFTSKDKLLGTDTDESADLYQATVGSGGGPAVLTHLSTGAPPPAGDSDACDPTANADGNNWNAVGGASTNSCGVVAVAGGRGVASDDGTVYFYSPEILDGGGTPNEPNLFVVPPGSSPQFVATVEPENPAVRNGVADSEIGRYGDFQVTATGDYAAFITTLPLQPDYDNAGHMEVYRYGTSLDELACVSCNFTEESPSSDAALPAYGLGLTDDGRLFFNSREQLTLRDTNGKLDAYEWKEGVAQLISTGTSAFPSGLLGVSADGADAFFFTRDKLVPGDRNGQAMKIYDAREDGGFFVIPPPPLCAASDECHGPGSQAAEPPGIATLEGAGSPRKATRCKKGFVKKRGRCVKKKKHRRGKKHTRTRPGGRR